MEPPGLSTASRNSSMSSDPLKKTKHAMGPTLNSLRGTRMDGTSVQMDSQRRGLQTRAANQYNSNFPLQMVLIAPFMKAMHRLWTRRNLNWQCGNTIIVFLFLAMYCFSVLHYIKDGIYIVLLLDIQPIHVQLESSICGLASYPGHFICGLGAMIGVDIYLCTETG